METKDYKSEIINTRKGCLGSSDGKLLAMVATLGYVPKSCFKRLAIVKGLIPNVDTPTSAAMKAGDDLEMIIFNYLKSQDPRYESNPLWVSEKLSRKNVKLISHPDLVLKDEARKVLNVYECKCTKFSVEDTRQTYKEQLYIHSVLAKEIAARLGKEWRTNIYLVHYSTEGLDLSEGLTFFDASRLTIKSVKFSTVFRINRAMDVIDDFLETFEEFYEGEEVNADNLPVSIKSQFDEVAAMLIEIKEREDKVNDFKKRLYEFMRDKNIKSIKNDVFSITRVDETVSKSFDHKRYIDDLSKEHPVKAKKILAQYTKETKRNGYATIKVKN